MSLLGLLAVFAVAGFCLALVLVFAGEILRRGKAEDRCRALLAERERAVQIARRRVDEWERQRTFLKLLQVMYAEGSIALIDAHLDGDAEAAKVIAATQRDLAAQIWAALKAQLEQPVPDSVPFDLEHVRLVMN